MSNVRNVVGNVFSSAYACAANLPLKAKVLANDSYSKVSTIATKLFSSIQANATDVRERIVKSSLFASLTTLAKKVSDFFNSIFKNKKEELDENIEDQFVMIPSPRESTKIQKLIVETPASQPAVIAEEAPASQPAAIAEETPAAQPAVIAEETPAAQPAVIAEEAPAAQPSVIAEEAPAAQPAVIAEETPAAPTGEASASEAEDQQVDETGESSESDSDYDSEDEEEIESQPGYVSSFFNGVANTLMFWKR